MPRLQQFWVFNISKKAVSIADLGLVIQPGVSYNLLDSRHFKYSQAQLEDSAAFGSLKAKEGLIGIRRDLMPPKLKSGIYVSKEVVGRKINKRSQIKVEEVNLDELLGDEVIISDQKFAEEFVEEEEKKKR